MVGVENSVIGLGMIYSPTCENAFNRSGHEGFLVSDERQQKVEVLLRSDDQWILPLRQRTLLVGLDRRSNSRVINQA